MIEHIAIRDPHHVSLQTLDLEALHKQLLPFFEEERLFLTQMSEICQKLLSNSALNDQERYIVSFTKPFCSEVAQEP